MSRPFRAFLSVFVALACLAAGGDSPNDAVRKHFLDAARRVAEAEQRPHDRADALVQAALAWYEAGHPAEASELARAAVEAESRGAWGMMSVRRVARELADAGLIEEARRAAGMLEDAADRVARLAQIASAELRQRSAQQAQQTDPSPGPACCPRFVRRLVHAPIPTSLGYLSNIILRVRSNFPAVMRQK